MLLIIDNTVLISPTEKTWLERQRKKRPGHPSWSTMAYTIIGKTGYMSVNVTAWGMLLKLSERFGWKPAGTESPAGVDEWGGNYIGRDGQLVTDKDATALAMALERALDDIPEQAATGTRVTSKGGIKNGADVSPIEYFSDRKRKKAIRDFIAFCKISGFTIN